MRQETKVIDVYNLEGREIFENALRGQMQFKAIRGSFVSAEQLLEMLRKLPRKQSTLLGGVDGCGGSGKSAFIRMVEQAGSDVTVVHMDDFYLPSAQIIKDSPLVKPVGADFDWLRLKQQVLEPLGQNRESRYQRYDWGRDRIGETWYSLPVGGIVIVEGVYSIRRELAPYYDLRIWVECPRDVRLARGLARDGEEARYRWENDWMVAEDLYIKKHNPVELADLVLDGSEA